MRRLGGFLVLLALLVIASAAPAAAELTENSIGCKGTAVIHGDDGSTTSVSADDATVTLPTAGDADYEGSVATVTHNHFGEINLEVGPGTIELGSWKGRNDTDQSSKSGTKQLASALADVPPGRYDVSGFHQGDEGRCAGHLTVEVAGSLFSSPISASSTGLGALALIALVFGVLRGRPILAAFAGLLFGAFAALDLVFARTVGSGSILLLALPLVLLVLGAVVALLRLRSLRSPLPGDPPPLPA